MCTNDLKRRLSRRFGGSRRLGSLVAFLLMSGLLSGCVNPITQLTCDGMAKKAISSIAAGDAETLASLLENPEDAQKAVAQFPDGLPHGKIKYRGDSQLFPLPTYDRYYEVLPLAGTDSETQSVRVVVRFVSDPLRIEGLWPYDTHSLDDKTQSDSTR